MKFYHVLFIPETNKVSVYTLLKSLFLKVTFTRDSFKSYKSYSNISMNSNRTVDIYKYVYKSMGIALNVSLQKLLSFNR